MKKKLVAILTAMTMVLGLTACGNAATKTETANTDAVETTAETETF